MGRERNLDSIRAMEKEIEERDSEATVFKLKRARNSLLNITILVPPEILGRIFHMTMIQQARYWPPGVPCNILLVCHHWFEVALRTPQLWTSWGSTLQDWKRCYTCPKVPRFNLVLKPCYWARGMEQSLDEPILEALRGIAARDFIRWIYLSNAGSALLNSIISSVTPRGEGIQSTSLESIKIRGPSEPPLELTDFFSCQTFPKLRHLRLSQNCNISPWDLLASRITTLVTLSFRTNDGCPIPTASQLFQILSCNPNLEYLKLSHVPPNPNGGWDHFQVQLRHLKRIKLSGSCQDVLGLLNGLETADRVDKIRLDLLCRSTSDISQTLARYLGAHLQRRGKVQEGLAVEGNCVDAPFYFKAGDFSGFDDVNFPEVDWFMNVTARMERGGGPREEESGRFFFDSLVHIPHDNVVYYDSPCYYLEPTELSARMPNLVVFRPGRVHLPWWFAEPDPGTHPRDELFPSLRYLSLHAPTLGKDGWSPLTTFLSRRASVGNKLDSLALPECSHICPEIAEGIRKLVGHIRIVWGDFEGFSPCDKCYAQFAPDRVEAEDERRRAQFLGLCRWDGRD